MTFLWQDAADNLNRYLITATSNIGVENWESIDGDFGVIWRSKRQPIANFKV
jgi:hypothetical protein